MFALGVILYISFYGAYPFDLNRTHPMPTTTPNFQPNPVKIPRRAENLIKRMLDFNPFTRITIDQILAHPWYTTEYSEETYKRGALHLSYSRQ